MTAIIAAVQCKGPCQEQVAPSDIIQLGPHVGICEKCMERHEQAMDLLSGRLTLKGCQCCGISLEALKAAHPTGEPPMAVHQLDGVYVALCLRCDRELVQLQWRMYRGTPFGALRNIQ